MPARKPRPAATRKSTRLPADPAARPRKSAQLAGAARDAKPDVRTVLAELERMGDPKVRAGMSRYGIPSDNAVGIPVGALRTLGKRLGPSHELALALWASGLYEARLLAAFVGEPAQLTRAQLDRFCRDFDNWAVCDTMCFALFDRSAHAYGRIEPWSERKPEFEKRAAFALLASLALHDKAQRDEVFLGYLPLIASAASDARNFVKKGVSWALRGLGARSAALHAPSVALARELAADGDAARRWVGKDALRDLTRPAVLKRLNARAVRAKRASA